MPRRRSTAIMAIALLAVLGLAWWAVTAARPVQDGYTGHAASPSPSSSESSLSEPTSPEPRAGLGSAPARPTWDPVAAAAEESEGAAAEAKVPQGEGAEPYRLPVPPARAPVLTSVPPAAEAQQSLAEGFPQEAVPVPDGAEVQSSSIAPQGQRAIIGVVALSEDPAETLADHYALHCADLAWPLERETAPNGDLMLECGFGADRLTVTVSSLPTGWQSVTATGAFLIEDSEDSNGSQDLKD